MTDKLPPNLLALFAPRPPLRYVLPCDRPPEERKTAEIRGVAEYLDALREYRVNDKSTPTETWQLRHDRKKMAKRRHQQELLTSGFEQYKAHEDPQVRGDPFKTLFVARLSYSTEVKDLEREFGRFGPIERIRIVQNTHATGHSGSRKKHTSRGYAFILYERERDMKAAYKETDGIRINDRRILVDVERGRTVSGWKPRRFGGGLGGRGYTKTLPSRPLGMSGSDQMSGSSGYRRGFCGGYRNGRSSGGYKGGGSGGGGGYDRASRSSGMAPEGAPSGPRGSRGQGDRDRGGGRSHDDRPSYRNSGGYGSGSNREHIRGSGYRNRDRDRDRDRDGETGGGNINNGIGGVGSASSGSAANYSKDDVRKRSFEGIDTYENSSRSTQRRRY